MKFETVNFLAEDETSLYQKNDKPAWKILVVDEEGEFHAITKLALRGFKYFNHPLEILHAYSAAEAVNIVQNQADIAIVIIDMERECPNAGMKLVSHIRTVMCNQKTRIVIRSGHRYQLEPDAASAYDIDDINEKSSADAKTLITMVSSRLRVYRDLRTIEAQRNTFSKILDATANDQSTQSIQELAFNVIGQVKRLLDVEKADLYCAVMPANLMLNGRSPKLYETEEIRRSVIYGSTGDCIPELVLQRLGQALETRCSMHFDDAYIAFTTGRDEVNDGLMYLRHGEQLTPEAKQLLELYAQSVSITFENLSLHNNLQETQRELVYLLGGAVEARSKETGAHVKRVSICSGKLASLAGLSEATVNLITLASPLHDIGKLGIPDSILHKPGQLESHEWEIMKRHAEYGRDILLKSANPVMRMGARIAYTHHERWDGKGYPQGLRGKEIPIEGRITTLVDVFDALGSRRSYKKEWSTLQITASLLQGKGTHFDPELVDLFVANLKAFQLVRAEYPDN